METKKMRFGIFFWRVTAAHIITYFILGLIASTILDYKEIFSNPPLSYLMKPTTSPWVAAGPILQIFRGLVFSIALWFIKDSFLFQKYGWIKLWIVIVGLSILSTVGPTPGSIEGIIYTKIPIGVQLKGYLEVLPQTLLFSVWIFYWHKSTRKLWNVLAIILVSIIFAFSILGVLSTL